MVLLIKLLSKIPAASGKVGWPPIKIVGKRVGFETLILHDFIIASFHTDRIQCYSQN